MFTNWKERVTETNKNVVASVSSYYREEDQAPYFVFCTLYRPSWIQSAYMNRDITITLNEQSQNISGNEKHYSEMV